MSTKASIFNKKIKLYKGKTYHKVSLSMKEPKNWNGSLTPSFLENATNGILSFNELHELPIIYAKNGVIIKKTKSAETILGKIEHLKRMIPENSYKI